VALTAGHTPREPATRWGAVGALMAAGVVAAAQLGKSTAALPALQADLGLSLSAAAWFLSAISLVGAVAGAGLGWAGQSLGFRRQVQAGLLLMLVMNIAGVTVRGSALLMATRVGEGLGFALVVLAAPGLLTTVTAAGNRRLVVGAWGAYMPIGLSVGTLLTPAVMPFVGWRGVWAVAAVITLGALVAVTRSVPGAGASGRPSPAALLAALRSPGVVSLAAVFTLYAGQYLAVLGLLPAMLVRDGLSVADAGLVTGIAFIANAPGNVAGAVLQHRGAPRHLLVIGGSAVMGSTVWLLYDDGFPLGVRIAAAVLFSFTAGLVPSAAFNGVAALTAGTAALGAAMGLLMQGSSLGQLLVPPLVAAAGGSWAGAPGIVSGLAALAVVGGLVYRQVEARR
jgi:predicted MFS family arabinose efflux permease